VVKSFEGTADEVLRGGWMWCGRRKHFNGIGLDEAQAGG
jgi:hypothetical protein